MHHDRQRRCAWLTWGLWGVLGGCDSSVNTPPEVLAISAWPSMVAVGETSQVTVTPRDLDGDPLGYQWSSACEGAWADASFASARFTPTRQPDDAGTDCSRCALTVDVTDGRGGHARGELSLCVRPDSIASSLPRITERFQSSSRVPENGAVFFQVKAEDPRGRALSFTWTATRGTLSEPRANATVSQVSWSPERPMDEPGARPAIAVTVTNAVGLSTQAVFSLLKEAPE